MTAVRGALVLGAVVLAGCRPPLLMLDPAPAAADVAGSIATSLFLIGDAGYAVPEDAVLGALRTEGRAAPRSSAVVFLGDNIYPRGLPEDTAAGYAVAKARLDAQSAIADSTGLRVIFIPGNHDWDRHRPTGWAQIQRMGAALDQYARERGVRVELQPRGGCPGPVVTDLAPGLRLVAIDTQWWLHDGPRPGRATDADRAALPDPEVPCADASEEGLVAALATVHRASTDAVTVMVGHHPLRSSAEHGGYHPWVQYLFPFVPAGPAWLWLPIGWIYPLGRKLWGDDQDFHGRGNKELRRRIEGTFSESSPLLYISGHDHALELQRSGSRFFAVSGSGGEAHQGAVGRSDSTAFSVSRPGYMRLDLMADGRVRLGVTALDERRRPTEVFQTWLRQLPR